jgi:hypothetical protein
MHMKPSSPRRKVVSRTAAWNAALVNQFATPGLGSLMAGRWVAGIGQLLLAVAGFVLVLVWFCDVMIQYYGQISGNVQLHPVGWVGELGAVVFGAAWLWSLVTSINLVVRAGSEEPAGLQTVPPPTVNPPAEPPKLSS